MAEVALECLMMGGMQEARLGKKKRMIPRFQISD